MQQLLSSSAVELGVSVLGFFIVRAVFFLTVLLLILEQFLSLVRTTNVQAPRRIALLFPLMDVWCDTAKQSALPRRHLQLKLQLGMN